MCRKLVLALTLLFLAFTASTASAGAVWFGDHYRLGDADPGAAAGDIANSLTVDSGSYARDLSRSGRPAYSSDVPAWGWGSKLSMRFPNSSLLDGPTIPSFYSYASAFPTLEQGYGLETWVKTAALTPPDPGGYALIAYNGDPFTSGFGFFQKGDEYIVRAGKTEKVLAKASTTEWVHLAYIHWSGDDEFYVMGQSVGSVPADAASAVAGGAFSIGGAADGSYLFDGWVDETRFVSFNPLAMGAFSPTDFLIGVPEPGGLVFLTAAALLLRRTRRYT